jgi:NTP pyrophosphatase (non-canonical NTP hydrolase)
MGYPTYDLTFNEFQSRNEERSRAAFPKQCMTPEFLAVGIAGEAGEMCNLVKKVMRGDFTLEDRREEILDELADVMTYCDLFMSLLNERTSHRLQTKFNEVSKRRDYQQFTER